MILKLKDDRLTSLQNEQNKNDLSDDISDLSHIVAMYSDTLGPEDHATKLQNLHKDQRNWERVFISKDKFSGSLRYTHDEAESNKKVFRKLFKGLTSIEIHSE